MPRSSCCCAVSWPRRERPGAGTSRSSPGGSSSSAARTASWSLADYKVRILEGTHGTGAVTRVLIGSDDGSGRPWDTVGVDENIIAASWQALEEAVTYCLLRSGHQPG
jgi:hypothetical protein